MPITLAHLGPAGTYAEMAALAFGNTLSLKHPETFDLHPYPSIAQSLQALDRGEVNYAIVPVENSLEGSVNMTLDTLWQLKHIQITQALVLPISHAFVTQASDLTKVQKVYSHPQALGQCQPWLQEFLPQASQIPTNSTSAALAYPATDPTTAAITSMRAAQLHNLPILAHDIQAYPHTGDAPINCTRFWVMKPRESDGWPQAGDSHTSLAFSLPKNRPGALVQALLIFAERNINLSRIESRPSKRSLGDYLFFLDLEVGENVEIIHTALEELQTRTEVLHVWGSYSLAMV
ncbi:prephenate dehydratase [Thermosynechococcaceae cyanobacterium BACA0444]|uniref:Prephenate dehydratase n=1 Tax=Pseudocalidococcus azoricus BACA0444 TaxID=2918990 RepID=A0AAE4JYN1_9CYAN|nr:prephenate dehydratase [Pseudocalidococcus azoricus]MDS3859902.1 prephenate dehydratase [Pseudocalidococcus azoricus BACA0444]